MYLGSRIATSGLAALCATALFGLTESAKAVPCDELDLPNPIYGSGGSAITADLAGVATALAGLDDPITILYADQGGACTGYQWFADDAITGVFKYWDAEGTQFTCDPPLLGQPADFAHMGNPVDACPGKTLPNDTGDFKGPIQTLNVITDKDSPQKSISSEALYFILGFGADSSNSEVAPWINLAHINARQPTAFVSLIFGEEIGVDPAAFLAGHTAVPDQATVIANIVADGETSPETPLGYVSGSAADKARATVKTLAFQAKGQTCGYYPDSTETALDKLNVRYGQYALWTPGHFFAKIDANGDIIKENVAQLIGWFQGTEAAPDDIKVPELVSTAGDIPSCAMYAQREGFLGEISSYAPPEPCHCFFEVSNGGGEDCAPCVDDNDCADQDNKFCHYGFCEAY
jgi:hypothetical protein